MKESLQQTLRLILHDAYSHTDPHITSQIKTIHLLYPSLLSGLLPHSSSIQDMDGIEDEGQLEVMVSTQSHRMVTVIEKLAEEYCRTTLRLPIRPSQMDVAFIRTIQQAYNREYKMPNIYKMGKGRVRWWKKVGFYDQ